MQLLLYAGGVVTIVVFAIMRHRAAGGRVASRQTSRHLIDGALLSAAVFVGVIGRSSCRCRAGAPRPGWPGDLTARCSGRALLDPFVLPFELLGVLLLVALLGALYFARPDD